MKKLLPIYVLLLVTVVPFMTAQRRVTPVNNAATATQPINENREKNDSLNKSNYMEFTDDNGRVILIDTVTGKEFVDSTALPVVPKMIYPLFYGASVGVDIWDPVMRLFGQSYGMIEFSAEVNLHNRYMPVIEVGLGKAYNAPEDNNYVYRSPVSPYFRIGANYNFIYNSNPDYVAYAGIRYGFSPFKYQIDNVVLDGSYWGEDVNFNIPSQSATVGYLSLQFGIKVKIAGPVSLGWSFRYHRIIHESKATYGEPWYIPGFGTRNSAISGSFSIFYTLPIKSRRAVSDNTAVIPEPGAGSEGTVNQPMNQPQ